MYELVDFGAGRKLELVAGRLLNRPCPAAETAKPQIADWPMADATFETERDHTGCWKCSSEWNQPWQFRHWFGTLELSLSPFGHIGVFPEQADNWDWIRSLGEQLAGLQLLNLFACTGGSTLAAASMGAHVTHVDSARNTVTRARANAGVSGLADRPLRWIVEDASRFVQRELRRGNRYDGIIVDPPSFGRGVSKGQRWEIDRDLPDLLASLGELVPGCSLMICTCHSPGFTLPRLGELLGHCFPVPDSCQRRRMTLATAAGQNLPAGVCVRWFDQT